MVGAGPNNPNGKKKNLPKLKRIQRQVAKKANRQSSVHVLEATNDAIPSIEQHVLDASIHKRQTLLLKDVPHQQDTLKIVPGIRKARMGKHGMLIQATRINKKKVKALLKKKGLIPSLLAQVQSADLEMK
jgi:hypothetical protein